ncbi:MAG: hypothetical protein JNL82_18170 [Myxococcales bacterium]|nr:hypothetical protein [Myxococcales bacterium]
MPAPPRDLRWARLLGYGLLAAVTGQLARSAGAAEDQGRATARERGVAAGATTREPTSEGVTARVQRRERGDAAGATRGLVLAGATVASQWSVAGEAYDPFAAARVSTEVGNLEAAIPPQCYTQTGPRSNPCYACHTASHGPNAMHDWSLQQTYEFSDAGRINHWTNLFVDRRPAIAEIGDDEILKYVREDNFEPLRVALQGAEGFNYVPELGRGFDDEGFARDGSGWRAYIFKPFVGAFWATNGSVGDAFIRLPAGFRRTAAGTESRAVYRVNLAIVAAAVASDPLRAEVRWVGEPLDETAVGYDLDGDGRIAEARAIVGLPPRYFGGAADEAVRRMVYPEGTGFLHSVRYLDPDAPGLFAARMKELRYARKVEALDRWATQRAYEEEHEARQEGRTPRYTGSPAVGLRGDFGWHLQGFIEDEAGRLRLQTAEEQRFCMGCHNGIGVTVDQTFSFPRQLPGARGWGVQTLAGMQDAPLAGHAEPEYLTYMRRVGGGDELRANAEMLGRFFPGGALDEREVRRAAIGGDRDLAWLLAPSRARALALNKAYRLVVREQSFVRGRDAVLAPAARVHRRIDGDDTELAAAGVLYMDGRLQLAWP